MKQYVLKVLYYNKGAFNRYVKFQSRGVEQKNTAIVQNHVTIVRPCDRSNLNTSDSGAALAEYFRL